MNQSLETLPRIGEELNPDALDSYWYEQLQAIDMPSVYTALRPTNKDEQAELFLGSKINNPRFEYGGINLEQVATAEAKLLGLKDRILAEETNEVVQQLYRWRLNELIAKQRLIMAAGSGDMRRFKRYNEFIYGQPDKAVFSYTVKEVRKFAQSHRQSVDPVIADVAAILLDRLPEADFNIQDERFKPPTDEVFEQVRQITYEDLGKALDGIEFDGSKGGEELTVALQKVFNNLGIIDGSVEDTDESSMESVPERHAIKQPAKMKLGEKRFTGLAAFHEIGTHILRYINGAQSQLLLLADGLDRYENADEGVGLLREQVPFANMADFAKQERHAAILERHLGIALAYGVDGQPRDFKQVFEILFRWKHLRELVKAKPDADRIAIMKKAKQYGYNQTARLLKGTTAGSSGVAYLKDMVYRQGNLALWYILAKNPDIAREFNRGKFDPSNPRHVWALQALGIVHYELPD